jgi:DNA repair exonuclease SbcCD ATPase subunit
MSMIVLSIELERFGRFVEPARFQFSAQVPNLISGANGSGKSTLLAALSAAFVIPHRSGRADIRNWQPWGRELAPRVTVEFESGGRRYRLTKVFLQAPAATLEEERADGFTLVAEGDAVEQRLPAFLGGSERPGVDASARTWLLAGVLWVPQNRLADTEVDGGVQDVVKAALGAQTRSLALERIEADVRQMYERDWTPTGKLKQASPVSVLLREVDELTRALEQLRARLGELDALRIQIRDLESESAALESERARLEEEEKRLQAEVQTRREAAAEVEKLTLALRKAEAEFGRLAQILQARTTLDRQRAEAQERLAALEEESRKAAQAMEEAEAVCRRVQSDLQLRIAGAEKELDKLRAPSAETLERLQQLDRRRHELAARLESALLHAEIIPENGGRVEVLEGEPRGVVELRSHETARISGSPRIELRIPGFGLLRLTGPAESAAQLRTQMEQLEADWARIVEPLGAGSLEDLRRRRQQADDLLLRLDGWREALRGHEQGRGAGAVAREAARRQCEDVGRQTEERRRELGRLEEEARRLAAERRTDAEIQRVLDELSLEVRGLKLALTQAEARLAAFPPDLETRLEGARQAAAAGTRRLRETGAALEQARYNLAGLQGQAIYTALAEKGALLEQKQRELARARLEADAAKLLKETLESVQAEIQQRVLPRVEERAAAILSWITGGFAERLSLAPGTWKPARVRPSAADIEVPPERLSGGELEQLHLAVRLALAEVLTEKEPFPVVLDDALLATDERRLECILQRMEELQGRVQWLILTCHPERFSELSGAHVIRLDSQGAAA